MSSSQEKLGWPRAFAIAAISGSAVAGLALCIPLGALISGIYAAGVAGAIAIGAAATNIFIWNKTPQARDQKMEAELKALRAEVAQLKADTSEEKLLLNLNSRLAELEERLGTVETVSTFEAKLAEKTWEDTQRKMESEKEM